MRDILIYHSARNDVLYLQTTTRKQRFIPINLLAHCRLLRAQPGVRIVKFFAEKACVMAFLHDDERYMRLVARLEASARLLNGGQLAVHHLKRYCSCVDDVEQQIIVNSAPRRTGYR